MSYQLLKQAWFRVATLLISFFFLSLLFVSPPIKYSVTPSPATDGNAVAKDSPLMSMITTEHEKAINEIEFRLAQQDSWYHYKFIFIGALLALFLGQTELLRGRGVDLSRDRLKRLLTADSNYAVVALACVLALIVDMHIRNHMFAMQTLGLWIAHYVEPSLNVTNLTGFYPWEQFIRNPNSPSMHLDSLYRLAFSTHLHFMTTIIYLLYLTVLQQICLSFRKSGRIGRRHFVLFGFVFVHLSMLAFVFVAHAVPSRYEMALIPINEWKSGWVSVAYYLIPWLVIVSLNVPFLMLLRTQRAEVRVKSTAVEPAQFETASP